MELSGLKELLRKNDPRNNEIVSKMKRGNLITRVMPMDWYEGKRYPEVASATGFKVEKIATEGKKYPSLNERHTAAGIEQKFDKDGAPNVLMSEVKKGWVAVSIENLAGGKDFSLFWKALEDPLRYIKKV